MKKSIILLVTGIIGLIFVTSNTFGQTPGNIYVENRTDCDIDVAIFCFQASACSTLVCTSQTGWVSGTATNNSTTLISNGSGYTGAWGRAVMNPNNKEEAGPCFGPAGIGADCNSVDIEIIMDNCNLVIIRYE